VQPYLFELSLGKTWKNFEEQDTAEVTVINSPWDENLGMRTDSNYQLQVLHNPLRISNLIAREDKTNPIQKLGSLLIRSLND
jgi:hypothetical protein